jgi:outer membrane receptor for ferrienterochelin and colicin
LRLGLSYVDTELSATSVNSPYVARWVGSFNLDYQVAAKHSLGFSLTHNSHRKDTNSYTSDDAEAFTLVGLHAYGDITPDLSYSLGVDNLLNKKVYDTAADFSDQYNPERSERELWLRLTWRLGQ